MATFDQQVKKLLRAAVEKYGTAKALSLASGVSTPNISRWLRDRDPRISEIAPILDLIGAKLSPPDPEPDKDVCFVDARIAPIGEGVEPPQSEDYIAAPLVGEVGAGMCYIPQDIIEGWCLVSRNNPAVRSRSNLIAVEIGHSSYSMQPTLNPGDIVLVDKNDRNIQRCGHIMLVTDPEGAGMIKRVAINDKKDDDHRIIFYSDNNLLHPPLVYSLRNDYAGDWDKVVAGRVILALTDMRKK